MTIYIICCNDKSRFIGNVMSSNSAVTVPPWPVVGTLCQRELVRFFRQRNRVFGALGQPIIFWLLFGAGLGSARVETNISTTPISFPARW